MSKNKFSFITWTNTECEDIFDMYFTQQEKYFPDTKSYVFINDKSDKISNAHIQFLNKENDPFYKRLLDCLDKVEEDYVIYSQEDYVLYDEPEYEKINDALNFLKNSDYSNIRLIKSGNGVGTNSIGKNIYSIDFMSPDLFSQQIAIWKKTELKKIINFYKPQNYREAEGYGSLAMRSLQKKSAYYYQGEPQRGLYHCDSKIYPYVCAAIIKKKWNLSEYEPELSKLFDRYNVDYKVRGII